MGLYVCESCLKNYGLRDSGAHSCVCPCDICAILLNNPNPVWCHFTHDLDNPEKCGVSVEVQVKRFRGVQEKITRCLQNAHPVLKLLVLKTEDLEATKDFYALLGIEFQMEQPGHRPQHYVGIVDGFILEIYPTDKGSRENHQVRLGFEVSGLDEILALVVPTGGTVVRASYDGAYGHKAVVRDPDGRSVELYEKSRVPA